MRPRILMRVFTACLMVLGALFIFRGFLAQSEIPQTGTPQATPVPIYNPYPPGILPDDLNAEIARVLREIAFIEGRAIQRWQNLPPPTLTGQPPILKDTGTEAVETLGLCSTTRTSHRSEIKRARLAICRTSLLAG